MYTATIPRKKKHSHATNCKCVLTHMCTMHIAGERKPQWICMKTGEVELPKKPNSMSFFHMHTFNRECTHLMIIAVASAVKPFSPLFCLFLGQQMLACLSACCSEGVSIIFGETFYSHFFLQIYIWNIGQFDLFNNNKNAVFFVIISFVSKIVCARIYILESVSVYFIFQWNAHLFHSL